MANLDDDGLIVTVTNEHYGSIHGSIEMSSISETDIDYEYEVKILRTLSGLRNTASGIDDAKYKNVTDDFVGSRNTKN